MINSHDIVFTQRSADNKTFNNVIVPAVTASFFYITGDKEIKTTPIDDFVIENLTLIITSASYVDTASYVAGQNVKGTVQTSSFSQNAVSYSASLANYINLKNYLLSQSVSETKQDNLVTGNTYPITASNSILSTTAIYWNSSSLVTLVNTKQNQLITGSTYPITASSALTASYWNSSSLVASINTKQDTLVTGNTYPITASSALTASYWNSSSLVSLVNTKQDSLIVGNTYSITSSNALTSSFASTASYWNSSSLVASINTKQDALVTGNTYPITSSNALTSSFASTASYWNSSSLVSLVNTKQDTLVTGNTYQITASSAINSISASYWNSSSLVNLVNTKQNQLVTGSTYPITSSNSLTASYALNTGTSLSTGSTYPITSSQSLTASFASTASFWNSSSLVTLVNTKQNQLVTGSTYPITSSQSLTASYALNTGTSLSTGSTYPITSSNSLTASLANLLYDPNEYSILFVSESKATGRPGLYYDYDFKILSFTSTYDGFIPSRGLYSFQHGIDTYATGTGSHAEGVDTTANGQGSHAEGYNTTANGLYSHAEGYYTTANGNYSHAEGVVTTANGEGSHAEGTYTTAIGRYSHADGTYVSASGDYSHGIGNKVSTTGLNSITIGQNIYSSGKSSQTIGLNITASRDSFLTLGIGYLDNPVDNCLRKYYSSSYSKHLFHSPSRSYETYSDHAWEAYYSDVPFLNPDFWGKDLNLTFISAWTSGSDVAGNKYTYACTSKTPITPKHVIYVQHCAPVVPLGQTASFSYDITCSYAKKDGTIVQRRLIKTTSIYSITGSTSGSTTDLSVGLLNEDLPEDIVYCRLLSTSSVLNSDIYNIITNRKFPHLRSGKFHREIMIGAGAGSEFNIGKPVVGGSTPTEFPERMAIWRDIEGGDSSGPQFFYSNNLDEPIITGLHGGGLDYIPHITPLWYGIDRINEAIERLSPGEGYSATTASLTTESFSNYKLDWVQPNVQGLSVINLHAPTIYLNGEVKASNNISCSSITASIAASNVVGTVLSSSVSQTASYLIPTNNYTGSNLLITNNGYFGNLRLGTNVIYNTSTNEDLIVKPNGQGAFMTDGAGDGRGIYANDFQRSRSATNQVAAGAYSLILGGSNNRTANSHSVVVGGNNNYASTNAVVCGGDSNNASGNKSVICGGVNNTASTVSSIVLGGENNIASGNYSIASGLRAKTTRHGEFSHAAGQFGTQGDAQHTVLIARKLTSGANGAVPTNLTLNGATEDASNRLTIPPQTTWMFDAKISAYNSQDDRSAAFFYRGCLKRDNSNNTSLIGTPYVDVFKDTGMFAVSASINADSTNSALQIAVTGLANRSIRWVGVVDISQVSFSTTI